MNSTTPVLFESTATATVLADPANAAWVTVLAMLQGDVWDVFRRCFHVALTHFRGFGRRPRSTDPVLEISGNDRGEADQVLLREVYSGGPAQVPMFVPVAPAPALRRALPPCLEDFSVAPPLLSRVLCGAGRPPTDGLCLLRAVLGAIAMGLKDTPSAVHALLRRNPTFAQQCGFLGPGASKQPGELTSRALPGESVLEEFDTVMTRYGLWHHEQLKQVRANIASGAVELDEVLSFDTAHIEAASGCKSVRPEPTEDDPKPKSRKVGRLCKRCTCGKAAWEHCPHPWEQTDPGAAVVVKGPTRNHWAHKASIVATGNTDIPLSARVLNYAATHDGKTLVDHLAVLRSDLPETIEVASTAVADPAYVGKKDEVKAEFDLNLIVGIVGRKTSAHVVNRYAGIDHFTPSGVPVCRGSHPFDFRGRDIKQERFIWQAPQDDAGLPVCSGCPWAPGCMLSGGGRRHLRVSRKDFPQIDWDHPQHQARHRATYAKRTGVERAIKSVKVDLGAEHLHRRSATRVQAHLDRRMLVLHLLLAADGAS